MRIIDLNSLITAPILEYQSTDAASASIGQGRGDSHIYWLRIEPGGVIGPHPAGPAQASRGFMHFPWTVSLDLLKCAMRERSPTIGGGEA